MDQTLITTLINSSKDIAQLNLGYLGISVAILGVLGGVFVYFNIKPIKDKLSKQEETIDNLKKEAFGLLDKSETQVKNSLEKFKETQDYSLSESLTQQKDNIFLEVTNKIQATENTLLEKIDLISNDKDLKLKEILLSEMDNKVLSLDKTLVAKIEEYKKIDDERFLDLKNKSDARFKEIAADILELKAYKYDMEGKMGGIIFTIDALEKCLNDSPYLLEFKLNDLKEKIGKYTLSPELFIRLKKIINEIKNKKIGGDKYNTIIEEIEDSITVENKPKI